jgi:hypothetical protein
MMTAESPPSIRATSRTPRVESIRIEDDSSFVSVPPLFLSICSDTLQAPSHTLHIQDRHQLFRFSFCRHLVVESSTWSHSSIPLHSWSHSSTHSSSPHSSTLLQIVRLRSLGWGAELHVAKDCHNPQPCFQQLVVSNAKLSIIL